MQRIFRTALLLCMTLLCVQAQAEAAVKRYAVLPFTINAPEGFGYLEQAIPSMLSSRLYWQGRVEQAPASADKPGPGGVKAALANADYAVWGDVNIVGDNATMDMRVTGADGKEWRRSGKSKVNDLVAGLQKMAEAANSEVFGRPSAGGRTQPMAQTAPLNPEMVQRESAQTQTYLNPQIRYQGADGSRLRTQTMPYAAVGMAIADFDGDGNKEVVLASETALYMYRWTDRLEPLGEYQLNRSDMVLALRSIDLNRDGAHEIVVSSYDPNNTEPYSSILSFKGGAFSVLVDRQRMYLSVANLPPDFRPTLIGQKGDSQVIFSRSGVYEAELLGKEISLTRKLGLPKGVNVFSFTWLPAGTKDTERLVSVNTNDRLAVFSPQGSQVYLTDEAFSGTAVGIEEQSNMPGLGKNTVLHGNTYYVPMRMIAADLDSNRDWELLVNKPISVASRVFDRYRSFPEGEVQALTWDGVGLSMLWKTRRIKGSVADIGLADVNNDKTMDLVVCLNTHPGALGFENRKTILVAYPLDMSSADPNTAPIIEN